MRIVIDAMGGDNAPQEIVRGATDAASQVPEATLILVGARERIDPLLAAGPKPPNIEVQHASQIIEMDEEPVAAFRRKSDSSMRVALRAVKHGEADAIISAGNTGALVGGAMLGLGELEGVKRPGIAIPVPTEMGCSAVIDVGANPQCKPIHLLQYGVMGSLYIKYVRSGLDNPTVGILNIGEESMKGTALHREAYALFQKSSLNFIGNVEPHKIFAGKVDVIVCDGFTGNIVLKATEGLGGFLLRQLTNGLASSPDIRKGIDKIAQRLDYSEYGGAPVLGVRGVVIKCHGRSKARAIANAVQVTAGFIKNKLTDQIRDEIKRMSRWGWLAQWWSSKKEESE
ncbi:MAG: phosphate acyltransferase PlsX [Planctomycetes bacterium]|nr:phosphate acyltransferase PlsX [Planctomycetota bacterium]